MMQHCNLLQCPNKGSGQLKVCFGPNAPCQPQTWHAKLLFQMTPALFCIELKKSVTGSGVEAAVIGSEMTAKRAAWALGFGRFGRPGGLA